MAQFNVYRNLNTASKKVTPYFLHVLLANESGNVARSAWAKLMGCGSSIFIACLALASVAIASADVSDANSAAQLVIAKLPRVGRIAPRAAALPARWMRIVAGPSDGIDSLRAGPQGPGSGCRCRTRPQRRDSSVRGFAPRTTARNCRVCGTRRRVCACTRRRPLQTSGSFAGVGTR